MGDLGVDSRVKSENTFVSPRLGEMSYTRCAVSYPRELDNEELDTSSGCDMSFELSSDNLMMLSPVTGHAPRKLDFSDCDTHMGTPGPKTSNYSPPYRHVRALRLFDSPLTPKTILEKSSACATPAPRTRLFGSDKPRPVASAYARNDRPPANVNPFTPNGIPSKILVILIIITRNFP